MCYSPLVTGAGAGAVHPLLLLVTVLVQPLPAVVEGGLDAAHAGHRVQGGLGRAQARVVTEPGRGQGPGGRAGRAPALPAPHADYRLRGRGGGGGGGRGGLVRGAAGGGRRGDHR